MEEKSLISEQQNVLENDKKNMIVSASAGSGKTFVMIKYITRLVCEKHIPIENILVLTFTKSAAAQMKDRLFEELKKQGKSQFIIEQLDALSTANISTIDSFCEKMLKKYAYFLNLNQNFKILDENDAAKLKNLAFSRAYDEFEKTEEFRPLQLAFRGKKDNLANITFLIERLIDVLPNKEVFLTKNKTSAEKLFDNACKYVFENFQDSLKDSLNKIASLHVDEFEQQLLKQFLPFSQAQNLIECAKFAEEFSFPYLPKVKDVGREVVDLLAAIKKRITSEIDAIKNLNLTDADNIDFQRQGILEKTCLKLYEIYKAEQISLKKAQNCLDFADLENYMTELSQHHELFEKFEYVFVDEYQDTNRIQEKIIKNVAKNCNFVAVGDVKQGIYGFRLASKEIFLQDLNDFETDENSAVKLLTTNFRSAKNILDFVNDIFSVCMTKSLTGVDYASTSMLKQFKEIDDDQKIVVDICQPVENEVEQKPEVYSVKDATVYKDRKNENLLLDIKRRILECLDSKIDDEGKQRVCQFSDIAILTRKRTPLFDELGNFLRESGIPVISNASEKLMSKPEMQMLVNYLKLALSFDDDVALLSVLLGGLYRFKVEDILKIKEDDKTLCQCVLQEGNFDTFKQDLSDFKVDFQVFGIKKAFERLFDKTDFYAYVNLYKPNLDAFIETFFKQCEASNFDLPNLVNLLETVQVDVENESAITENAVRLTTIHDSKGLEYPVVFLIGCDNSISKVRTQQVEINDDFGLAVKTFDFDENIETTSVRMQAIRQAQRKASFSEEMMLFYVALTRAKNKLYLFGLDQKFDKKSLSDCDTYFDFLFYAYPDIAKALSESDKYENEKIEVYKIDSVSQIDFEKKENENPEYSSSFLKQITDYINFEYKFSESKNFKMKESVTNLSKRNVEDVFESYKNDSFSFSGKTIEIGNAYHLALKSLDFDRIKDMKSLTEQLEKNSFVDLKLIDKKLLLEDILKLKGIFGANRKVFKEKEFVMREKISKLIDEDIDDEILLQGIIDLFVDCGEYLILVDYKYSSMTKESLINRYKNQLKFYKLALENAFSKPVKETYLLSLKDANLIKVEDI